jgi:anaerobic selenocysteine-containing dehydrogenase/cytochrome P450
MRTAHRTCPICDAVCGLRLTLDQTGHVLSVKGDPDDPFSHGYICPKGASLGKLDEDPDRLSVPMIREGDQWREASWEEAFRLVDERLTGVIQAHGRDAAGIYFGNPTYHTMAGFMYREALTQALGSRNTYSASTIDQIPKHISTGHLFGDPFAIAVPDVDRTDYLLVIGANPLESHGSLCAAPDFYNRLKALRERGGKLVVVDPRRTRTAEFADEHLFVRPGTDPLLLFGIVHTLLAEDLAEIDLEVNGLAQLRELAAEFTPDVVAPVCGVPAQRIVRLARELAAAPTAAVYTRIGTSTVEFGTLAQWLVDVVNILTGNFDRPGGVMFTRTAALEIFRTGQPFATGRWHSRVRGLPEVLGEIPVATMADEIETPGEGQLRALVCLAGNLVLSAPNGPRLDRVLPGLDFMVCVDPYLNETTKHADVILPPPRIMQMPHYDFLLLIVTVRNYTRYSPQVLPLGPGQRSEAEIFARLLNIIAGQGADADPAATDDQILDAVLRGGTSVPGSPLYGADVAQLRAGLDGDSGPELLLDAMLKLGPYGLSLATLRANPHGIDLGPLQPRLKELLTTASGRIELTPPPIVADVQRLRERYAGPQPEILLIGRRQLRSNNSWLHNTPALVGGSNRCTLHVHPSDVARLGLGERAVVRSATGEVVVPVEANDKIMPGVVSLPHGWGHEGSPQRVAAEHAGVNANALTDETVVDVLSGNAVFNGVPVTVSPDLPGYPYQRECPYRPSAQTARLRAPGPMMKVRLYDGKTAWLVTGPAQARALLADKRMSSLAHYPNYPVLDERHLHMRATREMAQEEDGGFAGVLFGVDPPEHTRQRQQLLPSFTARRVAVHRPEIQRIVDEHLDAMLDRQPPVDLMTAFAVPVPMKVVCAFLGVPYADREHFEGPATELFDPEHADEAMERLTGYLDRLILAKETDPGNGLLDDLIAGYVRTGQLTRADLVPFALAILVAGTVTSTSTIALGTLALLDTPGQYAALVTDPGLVPDAVEEILRHVSLVEQLARVATEDIEIDGHVIKAGDGILVSFAGANLDPSVTTHPGELDITRPPSNHLAFSYGIHHCMGHNLARLELDIAFRTLVQRIPTLRPAVPVDQIPWFYDFTVPRLLSFPVTW